MKLWNQAKRVAWLPQLNYQIWILAFGRLLSQMGSGFTMFYAPIFFVNEVGLSATAVGLGIGSGSLSDGKVGRKRTLLMAALVAAIASFVLAATLNFSVFVVGNLLMGFGIGLYWPSAEAMVADLSTPEQWNEAFALNRLCDGLGLGLGVVLGGLLINTTGAYRALFVVDGISFLVLFVVVLVAVNEVFRTSHEHTALKGWRRALRDRTLLVYCAVNILFTTYIVQISSTLPLYLTNFVPVTPSGEGFDSLTISALFTWHLLATVVTQLPIARFLNRFDRVYGLILSALLWAVGFVTVWATGIATGGHLYWAILALAILALSTVTYMPVASAIVVDMAPDSLRGIYLAVNSQCWAIGYFIGPPLGGWALDQSPVAARVFWLWLAASVVIAIGILLILRQLLDSHPRTVN